MPTRRRDRKRERTVRRSEKRYQQLVERVHTLLGRKHVDLLRSETGYNPRQRVATAHRLLLTCVEGCLSGQTLGFSTLRAFFVKRFGPIRPRAFQLRFKSSSAVAFFERALSYLVAQVLEEFAPPLTKTLSGFADIHVYDASQQRVPARGRKQDLCSTKPELGGSKWLIGYSLRHGAAFHALGGSGCMPELKNFWHLVGRLRPGVLYLVDLAYFSREMFIRATEQGAFVLMRLKACKSFRKQLHVVSAIEGGVPYRSLGQVCGCLAGYDSVNCATHVRVTGPQLSRRCALRVCPLQEVPQSLGDVRGPTIETVRMPASLPRSGGCARVEKNPPRTPEQLVATYRYAGGSSSILFREWKQQVEVLGDVRLLPARSTLRSIRQELHVRRALSSARRNSVSALLSGDFEESCHAGTSLRRRSEGENSRLRSTCSTSPASLHRAQQLCFAARSSTLEHCSYLSLASSESMHSVITSPLSG